MDRTLATPGDPAGPSRPAVALAAALDFDGRLFGDTAVLALLEASEGRCRAQVDAHRTKNALSFAALEAKFAALEAQLRLELAPPPRAQEEEVPAPVAAPHEAPLEALTYFEAFERLGSDVELALHVAVITIKVNLSFNQLKEIRSYPKRITYC